VKEKRVYIYSPAYLEYKKIARVLNKEVILINRFENLYADILPNSLVVFVNPSTPDGKYYDLKKLFKIWQKVDAKVLIDESFLDFCESCKSAKRWLKSYKKLYILKSLTKIYSSAGVRVGVIISSKKNIKKLKKYEPLWKISEFDKNYILEAIKDKKFIKKTQKRLEKNKKVYIKKLESLDEVEKVYKSSANFLLLKLKKDAKNFIKRQEKNFVMVRDCRNFDFLDERFVRVAIKRKSDVRRIV